MSPPGIVTPAVPLPEIALPEIALPEIALPSGMPAIRPEIAIGEAAGRPATTRASRSAARLRVRPDAETSRAGTGPDAPAAPRPIWITGVYR